MRIDILSLFPDMFQATLGESIVGKAQDNGFLDIKVTDFRDYTDNKHNRVDDTPFGGGAGMLLQAQPIFDAMAAIDEETKDRYPKGRVILMDPAGRRFDQDYAQELSQEEHLFISYLIFIFYNALSLIYVINSSTLAKARQTVVSAAP